MIETSSLLPGKSLVSFRDFWKMFGNDCLAFGQLFEHLRKSSERQCSEIFGKSLKKSLLVCLYIKQNITCPLVDMNFVFSCSTWYLMSELPSLLRCWVEHSKIKFISTRRHVIFSISAENLQTKSLLPSETLVNSHHKWIPRLIVFSSFIDFIPLFFIFLLHYYR